MATEMTVTVQSGDISQTQADAIIVNLFEGVTEPAGGSGAVNQALKGVVGDEIRWSKAFSGKLGETLILNTYGAIPSRYVIVVGLGKPDELGILNIRRAAAAAIRACTQLHVETAASILHGAGIGGFDVSSAARLLVEGTLLGAYHFLKHKKVSEETPQPPTNFYIVEFDEEKIAAIEEGCRMGEQIAHAVNRARDWVFDAANHVTPTFLMEQAKEIPRLQCQVLPSTKIKELGMEAFSLVAQGSDHPSYLIHLTYKPKDSPLKKVALVGKGITFDSGGLSLKPPKSQETMKMDMAGAAAVLATMTAISEMGNLPVQVDAFIPTCENMPSGHASKPGDVVRAMNGKTIEVNNTDAEGRLILCDALTYAQKTVEPDEMIDLATLTGACVVALGDAAAGIMGTSDNLINNLIAAGEHAGENLWRLPLYDAYQDALKSDVADLKNAGAAGKAGSSTAGMFLKEFVEEDMAWSHLDIAGPAYVDKDTPEVPKGATGFGVRTLLYYLYSL